jgi:aspartyl-tRNA(Asn)/glutamyl-tRNA(Gln) amidotransferase subunit B
VPLWVNEEWLGRLRESMPDLPSDKRAKFLRKGLNEYQTQVLTATRRLSDYFETAADEAGDPITTANWVTGELMGMLGTFDKITPQATGKLVRKMNEGQISGKMAKGI